MLGGESFMGDRVGWKQLVAGTPWFHGEGAYPIPAYSEYMPPPRLGWKPYWQGADSTLFSEEDPWGWNISEVELALELQPGLAHLAQILVGIMVHLGHGEPAHGISEKKLDNNPYWPAQLAAQAGSLHHEHYVVLLPLAMSRTQDDKGRIRWTLFGGSEHGPARAFWQGFFQEPGREIPDEEALGFFRRLLTRVYGEARNRVQDLAHVGFRIDGDMKTDSFPYWDASPLPAWTKSCLWKSGQALTGVKYLLTFRPFAELPEQVQKAYLAGELHLLPFPGSMVFWGSSPYRQMQHELPLAMQIPLLHSVPRHEAPYGIRVPQSGWVHESRPGRPHPAGHGPLRNTYRRTHRWARVHRDEDELAVQSCEEPLLHVLFSTDPDDMGLYGKPMARNAQIWTHEFHMLLDGPSADRSAIKQAEHEVLQGGLFGYRFQYPAMRVGPYEVYWHRPLAAFLDKEKACGQILSGAPLGYLTAYDAQHPDPALPILLWPRLRHRDVYLSGFDLFQHLHDLRPYQTSRNIRRLLDARVMLGMPLLPHSFARQIAVLGKDQTLDQWLDTLPDRALHLAKGRWLADQLRQEIEPAKYADPARVNWITYDRTNQRAFEVAYWKTIAFLAHGRYRNKDNADCISDSVTRSLLRHRRRDLEALGDYLIDYYRRKIAAAKMKGRALVGDLPFQWKTDFDFEWSGGWLNNQAGRGHERNIMAVIPGRDRSRAIIMADHYDTAYMEDYYEKKPGTRGARVAAAGADDNHSATAALMLAAPIFLEMSRAGQLACDIWLVHLTGEEFPSDCLGARHLSELLVEGRLIMRLHEGTLADFSSVRVEGVFVSDMIAHNNDRARDIFQIAPGMSAASLKLAYLAHQANEAWNAGAALWNERPSRKHAERGRRSTQKNKIPLVALHPRLSGEVRLPLDPRSTLYNTDGQIFSDAGVPVVLFMENYDINRSGYHDSHDTMANIDLDYGSAVAAIVIESVARAATSGSTSSSKRATRKRKTRK
jgi:hypothetical protein